MYISDLIKNVVNEKLNKTFVGKAVQIDDLNKGTISFIVKTVKLSEDDGYVWLDFVSDSGEEYMTDGEGLDIWVEILE